MSFFNRVSAISLLLFVHPVASSGLLLSKKRMSVTLFGLGISTPIYSAVYKRRAQKKTKYRTAKIAVFFPVEIDETGKLATVSSLSYLSKQASKLM